jgi:EmrB/QacA subfamily drug resistance transporter
VVSLATALLLLDVTVVNVALPAIAEDLGADFAELQWVIDAYAVTLAAFLLTAGVLADRLGRRRVFVAGLAGFGGGSLLCGLAGSPLMLDLARAAQGCGAAAMFAASLALLANAFPARDRGTAFGIWGAVSGAALAIGPLVGGALVDGLGWEWIFLLNLPLVAALMALTRLRVVESRDPDASAVDWAGAVVFTAALLLLIAALTRGNAEGWGSPAIAGALCATALLLGAFALIELRAVAPMLDLRLFRRRSFSGTAAVAFTQSVAIYPQLLFLALYMQNVLGYSALETGLRVLPITLALFALAPIAGKLTSRVSLPALLVTGLLLIGAGLLLMEGISPEDDWEVLLPGFLVSGAGMGVISPALASAMVGVLPAEQSGLASGINNTFRQTGIAAGIAGLGAIFQSRISASLSGVASASGGDVPDAIVEAAARGRYEDVVGAGGLDLGSVREVVREGFVNGLNDVFLVAAVAAFAGVVLALLLIRARDFRPEAAAQTAGAE